jgi:hypothetical protein
MASKIRLSDGRELMVGLSGKRTAEALERTLQDGRPFMQFNTLQKSKVWVNPVHVAAIEDRPDLDPDSAT